jgi:hypothetical protein
MPRKRNRIKTRKLTISTTPQVIEYLRQLLETGLYGKNEAEAAERLLSHGLDEYLGANRLALRKDKQR